ncbi:MULTISPECIES: hypothetical protein [Streptomyces]|uniref:Lipoprotein n=1 Tax=Streptomyces fungicidicus TaxID=68203 RepID=A0A494UST7_9ACTN|nr:MULTISPECIES: hypothetical protein [Streptomyces]AYL36477.1 hypothetical protein CNQ36_14190 [Streptomyces fungicidicus]QKW00916.1 hypothetical protein HUT14_14090 [Streptomyces sp. NA02536]TQL22084.1 hypothetical protein FBY37_4105 [Streptomyces sp. SLBN-134]
MGMKSKLVLGAVVGIVVIGAVSANSGDADGGSGDKGTSASAEQQSAGTKSDGRSDAKPAEDKDAEKASQAEQFKAFVRKNGTPQEKDAVSHITKVQGADEQNDILDAADVYTDFTGGIMGEGTGPAKLIASAFADWKQSDNGLVTVYDADGEIIGNGNF